jgi:hypothetical protein
MLENDITVNGKRSFSIGDTRFQTISWVSDMPMDESSEAYVVGKTAKGIDGYLKHIDPEDINNVFELGIFHGGSTIFFDQFLNPKRMVAIDIEKYAPVLEQWISSTGSEDRVHTFYGVDQADSARLLAIYQETFRGEPLDLVLDDASHLLDETRRSFNTLFPKLREGGLYIIEDWAVLECFRGNEAMLPSIIRESPPMSILINEIVIASARASNVISQVQISDAFVLVQKGNQPLNEEFDIRDFA